MKILFLCVANSARSQMAEALAKKIFGDKAEIESAGSNPSGKVHPLSIQVIHEIGIDMSDHYSKSVEDLSRSFFNDLDYVVSLCAEEVCPVIASKAKKLRWALPDPGSSIDSFRETRDEIQRRLEEFILERQKL
jgi:arsenate reductase